LDKNEDSGTYVGAATALSFNGTTVESGPMERQSIKTHSVENVNLATMLPEEALCRTTWNQIFE
jgi:hypothetical protein